MLSSKTSSKWQSGQSFPKLVIRMLPSELLAEKLLQLLNQTFQALVIN